MQGVCADAAVEHGAEQRGAGVVEIAAAGSVEYHRHSHDGHRSCHLAPDLDHSFVAEGVFELVPWLAAVVFAGDGVAALPGGPPRSVGNEGAGRVPRQALCVIRV